MNTLLIVDDEQKIRQGLKEMVRLSGVPVSNIIECGDGQAALEILESQPVDVLFTDIRMPKMDGVTLVEAIQGSERRPLIVVISGYDDFACVVRLLGMGVKGYLLKPVEEGQIVEILRQLEEELARNIQYDRQVREIGCQLLKYMILNEHLTGKEVDAVQALFAKWLLQQEYVVCCLENSESEVEDKDHYLILKDVEGNLVYIVGRENKDFLLKNELWEAYVGVSGEHCGVADVRAAYCEARAARAEAFLRSRHEVQYREITEGGLETPDLEVMHRIAQMIGNDKISEALRNIEHFFAQIKKGRYGADALENGIYILIEDILHIYQNALQGEEEQLFQLRDIYSFPQIDDLMERLTGWMIDFHDKINVEFDDYRNKSRIQQAIDYIRQNYDRDLNMAVVSNHVSMNYSLFSYAFKQHTGTNFVNYLKELRVKEAKRLLGETDMRVIEISHRVGYENEKHFMKIFKSLTGVSPTEYRKNMQFREL